LRKISTVCGVTGTAKGAAITASLCASGRSTAEDPGGGKICSTAAARRRARPPGKFFRRPGWGRRPRDPALERHAGTGLRKTRARRPRGLCAEYVHPTVERRPTGRVSRRPSERPGDCHAERAKSGWRGAAAPST
jgi:hypothetical protein